jgi:hypothetical protein
VSLTSNTHSIDLESSSSQSLYASDSTSLSITGNMTVELWFRPESQPATTMSLVSKTEGTGNQQSWNLYYDNSAGDKICIDISSDGSTRTTKTVNRTFSNNTWYHLAFVYTASSGDGEFFVDGSSIGTVTGLPTSIYNSTSRLDIGTRDTTSGSGTDFFDGLIDDVRIWNITRTSSEINNNKSLQLEGNESGLVAYWSLNNILTDETTNGNTLTNLNTASFVTTPAFPYIGSTDSMTISDSTSIGTPTSTISTSESFTLSEVSSVRCGFSNLRKNTSTITNLAKS